MSVGGKVYVGNLGAELLDESDLEDEFEQFGAIKSIFVARNPPGFAYIDFEEERDAKGILTL
jgi:arginine/serine-rich splicing factor 7